MKLELVFAVALGTTSSAYAQVYKCNDGGRVVFSDIPCTLGGGKLIEAKPAMGPAAPAPIANPAATPPPANESNNPQAVLARVTKERQISDLDFQIKLVERKMQEDVDRMNSEIAVLRNRQRYANNNLAGATFLGSISQEMQAVAQRQQAQAAADTTRLNSLQRQREALMR